MNFSPKFAAFISRPLLLNKTFLPMLFWVNFLGTLYGYYWYAAQIEYTLQSGKAEWILFVPDSPTASLFFTLSILLLILWPKRGFPLRGWIEAFAVVTSVKYGIWAVLVIFAGWSQGDPSSWQEWMLIGSHLGMALEALLYIRYFRIKPVHIFWVAVWTLSNDLVDYTVGVYPWLPDVLDDRILSIAIMTVALSLISVTATLWISGRSGRQAV